MNPNIICGTCDYHINQYDKLVSHYMAEHGLSHSDAKVLSRQADGTLTGELRDNIDEAITSWLLASGLTKDQVYGIDYSFLNDTLDDLLTAVEGN